METEVQAGQPMTDIVHPVVTSVEGINYMDGKQLVNASAVPSGTTITVVDAGQTQDIGGLLQASEMMEIITQEVTTLAQANGGVGETTTTTAAPVMSQNGVVLQASELMKQIMEQVNIKQEDGEEAPQTVYAEIRPPDQMLIDDPGSSQGKPDESQAAGALVDSFAMYDPQAEMVQQSSDMGGSTKVLHVQATQEPIDGDPNNSEPSSRTLTVVITNFPDHLKTQILSYSCMSCGSAFNEVVDLMSHVCTGTAPLIANASSVVINTGLGGSPTELDPNKTVISTADLFYRCEECPKKYVKKVELVRHMKQAHKKSDEGVDAKMMGRVDMMSDSPESQLFLEQNMIITQEGAFQCAICMKVCKRKFDLKRHLMTHNNIRDRPHTCNHCDKRFLTASHLRQHLRAHTGIKPFECEECGKTFTRSSEVTRHRMANHPDSVHNVPQDMNESMESMDETVTISLPSSLATLSYECTDCMETFMNKKDLQHHLFEKHTFQCRQCSSVFPSQDTLQRHMAEHREEVYTCVECSMVFVHKKQLKQHNKQKHREKHKHKGKDKDKEHHHHHHSHSHSHGESSSKHSHNKVSCPDCGKEFRKGGDLKRHSLTHTDRERRHECELCQKKFLTKSHLKAHHMQKHSAERPNQCSFCDKKFARKHDLKRHLAIHDADRDRPFECEVCNKRYITGSHLREHQVVHTGMRPFICDICGATFTLQRAFLKHLKEHEEAPAEES